MSTLDARTSRLVWRWCVAYTAMAPRDQRDRRRIELQDHLHESERAGHRGRSVLRAAAAGVPDDLTWSFGLGVMRLLRAFLTPVPYLVAATILPIQAAFYWGNRTGNSAHVATGISELAAVGCLALAGTAYLLRRRH
ncbi:MAG TPA: hypothetical protein VJ831_12640 [Jatrophihabitantaceae bacterium]|nr:hypothetical protein [Jatrophihabitantaceae bacterium]